MPTREAFRDAHSRVDLRRPIKRVTLAESGEPQEYRRIVAEGAGPVLPRA